MDTSPTRPLLAIVGMTATGKTALAVRLIGAIPSVLISADSRQLYRGMDIVPGKDHPAGVPIAGIDLLDPDEPGSVAVWYDAVAPVIRTAWEAGKLPIVVGGTGLYVQALLGGVDTMSVPPDPALRARFAGASAATLQAELAQVSPDRLAQMNDSDRANPRRLLRALEIALTPTPAPKSERALAPAPVHILGLRYAGHELQEARIAQRVQARLAAGALAETRALSTVAAPQALSALGYSQLQAHLAGKLSEGEMTAAWVQAEVAYAKRQKTWFAKLPGVTWYDAANLDPDQVVQAVKAWYDRR